MSFLSKYSSIIKRLQKYPGYITSDNVHYDYNDVFASTKELHFSKFGTFEGISFKHSEIDAIVQSTSKQNIIEIRLNNGMIYYCHQFDKPLLKGKYESTNFYTLYPLFDQASSIFIFMRDKDILGDSVPKWSFYALFDKWYLLEQKPDEHGVDPVPCFVFQDKYNKKVQIALSIDPDTYCVIGQKAEHNLAVRIHIDENPNIYLLLFFIGIGDTGPQDKENIPLEEIQAYIESHDYLLKID